MEVVEDMGHLVKLRVENGHSSPCVVLPKFKKRKVSAVRDFPPGCGRNAQVMNSVATQTAVPCVGTGKNNKGVNDVHDALDVDEPKVMVNGIESQHKEPICDDLEMDAAKTLGNEVDSKTSIPVDIPGLSNGLEYEKGKALVLYDTINEEEIVDVECLKMEVPIAADNERLVELSRDLEYNAPKLLKDSQHVEFLDSVKSEDGLKVKDVLEGGAAPVAVSAGSLRSESLAKSPTAPATVGKNVAKNYPPRRRISAVRDFPALCGPNALLLGKAQCQKAIGSSEKGNSGPEKSGVAPELLAGRSNVKQIGSRLVHGDAVRDFPALCGTNASLLGKKQCQKAIASSEKNNMDPGKAGVAPKLLAGRSNVKQIGSSLEHGDAVRKKLGAAISQDIDDGVLSISGKDATLQAQLGTSSEIEVIDQEERKEKTSKPHQAANLHPHDQKLSMVNKPNLASGASGSKVKKIDFARKEKNKSISKVKKIRLEVSKGRSTMKKRPPISKGANKDTLQLSVDDVESFSEDGEEHDKYHIVQRSTNSSVSLPPFGVSSSVDGIDQDGTVTRNKVRETLRLFQAICRKLLHESESKSKGDKNSRKRVDLVVAGILKDKGKYVNTGKQIVGPVPGVEVGDEFHYRVELNIVGLHRQIQGGIDYLKVGKVVLATSIVASGGYADDLENSDTLIYSGSGGNVMQGSKEPEDQKLERGNLALKNSVYEKNLVRVIRGFKESKATESSDGRAKVVMTYTYDGLYVVEKYWQEMGQHGKLVFKFQLSRIPGQSALAWKEVKKANKNKAREGLCLADISQGKEFMPICAVNVLDNEKPPRFKYITRMIYPSWYHPTPPVGCSCVHGCSDSERCSCAIKNGGEIPYNHSGDIVEAKPLVFECGPSCKCPPSCHNRVTQRGTKFQLEVFKTESRGWGVRSLNSIPSGSFICEYIGELLEDKEADQRTGNDEYLFDIGHNYNDHTLWDGLSSLMPEALPNTPEGVEDAGFTIDAAQFGNVGRFFNHSCSPNLYAQSVLYDHEEKKMPHIMFFAAENIPPLQELTYHYNYTIDHVRDSNGNIKMKHCYCGSPECTGRMY